MKRTWLWISLLIVVLAAAGAALWYFYRPQAALTGCTGVAIYDLANYANGGRACLAAGSYTNAQLSDAGINENTISSIEVDPGFKATVYVAALDTNPSLEFTVDVNNLDNVYSGTTLPTRVNWNNTISSIKVETAPPCAVAVWDYANYGDFGACLVVGDYTGADLLAKNIPQNTIASIKIYPGFKATIYDAGLDTTPALEITADAPNLDVVAGGGQDRWGDIISSMRVVAATATPTNTVSLTTTGGQHAITVNSGASVPLTWALSNGTQTNLCTDTPDGWFTSGLTGTVDVPITTTRTYVLTCNGVSDQVVVTVAGTAEPTVTLTANPTSITAGQSSTLTWTSTDATTCSTSFNDKTTTSGSEVVTPTVTTSYRVSCTGLGGTKAAAAGVTVTSATTTCASPTSETRTQTCPTGQTGSITQTRTKGAAPTCAWGDWTNSTNTCQVASATTTTTPSTTTATTTTATTASAKTGPETPLVAGGLLSLVFGAYYLIKRKI